jgi:hypothetical protein
MDLDDLGDAGQVVDDVSEATLGDLQGHEGQDLVADGPQIEVGAEAGDDATPLQLVEPRLYGPACNAELACQLHHAGSWRLGERLEQASVECVDPPRLHRADRLADAAACRQGAHHFARWLTQAPGRRSLD